MPLRVFDIRKERNTRPRTIACLLDEAIDTEAMGADGCARYNDSLDWGVLQFAGDAQPTKFDIVPITRAQFRQCTIAAQREADRGGDLAPSVFESILCERAFDIGCARVHNVERTDNDGRTASFGTLERDRWEEIPLGWRRYVGRAIVNISSAPVPPTPAEDLGKS